MIVLVCVYCNFYIMDSSKWNGVIAQQANIHELCFIEWVLIAWQFVAEILYENLVRPMTHGVHPWFLRCIPAAQRGSPLLCGVVAPCWQGATTPHTKS